MLRKGQIAVGGPLDVGSQQPRIVQVMSLDERIQCCRRNKTHSGARRPSLKPSDLAVNALFVYLRVDAEFRSLSISTDEAEGVWSSLLKFLLPSPSAIKRSSTELGQFVPEFMHERIDVRSYERVGLAIQLPSFGSSKTVGYTGFRSSEHTNQQKGLLLIAVVLASAIFHHGFRLERSLKPPIRLSLAR